MGHGGKYKLAVPKENWLWQKLIGLNRAFPCVWVT